VGLPKSVFLCCFEKVQVRRRYRAYEKTCLFLIAFKFAPLCVVSCVDKHDILSETESHNRRNNCSLRAHMADDNSDFKSKKSDRHSTEHRHPKSILKHVSTTTLGGARQDRHDQKHVNVVVIQDDEYDGSSVEHGDFSYSSTKQGCASTADDDVVECYCEKSSSSQARDIKIPALNMFIRNTTDDCSTASRETPAHREQDFIPLASPSVSDVVQCDTLTIAEEDTGYSVGNAPRLLVGSFDLGEYGFAHCVGDVASLPPTILGIGLHSLGPCPYARDASIMMAKIFSQFPTLRYVVVEEQPPINRKTNCMEAALAALAIATPGTTVVHVPTSRISSYFGLPSSCTAKKAAAVSLLERLVDGGGGGKDYGPPSRISPGGRRLRADAGTFVCPTTCGGRRVIDELHVADQDEFSSVVRSLKRRHDIADAVLQFAWFANLGIRELAASAWSVEQTPYGTISTRATDRKNMRAEKRRHELACKRVERGVSKMLVRKKSQHTYRHKHETGVTGW
jgi:hypothetical protein